MFGLVLLGEEDLKIPPCNKLTYRARLPSSKEVGGLRLDSWLKEVDWIAELSFALAGRSRDYWYAQQLSMATMVWSVFVAVNGMQSQSECQQQYQY